MRKNYIVKLRFQMKFALIVFTLLSAVAIFVFSQGSSAMTSLMVRTLILGLAVTFAASLFFSHLVAGPLFRFEQVLNGIKDGRLNMHIQLRRFDELKDVADLFNQALSSLRNRVRAERTNASEAADRIEKMAEKLRKAGCASEAKELERLVEELKSTPSQIQI